MICKVCGKEQDVSHYTNQNVMEEHQMCFSCNFWRELLEQDSKSSSHTYAMIDGTHYVIGAEDDKSYFRGFGGAKFVIKFNDGTIVETTNLWCQGEPSKEWIDKFPNNAKFIDDKKWREINGNKYLI